MHSDHSEEQHKARQSWCAAVKALLRVKQPSPSDVETMPLVQTAASNPSACAEREFVRCAACFSELIVSKLGVAGVCLECQAPICAKCWRILGKRHCCRHTPSQNAGRTPADPQAVERIPAGIVVQPTTSNQPPSCGVDPRSGSPVTRGQIAAPEEAHVNPRTVTATLEGGEKSRDRSESPVRPIPDAAQRIANDQPAPAEAGGQAAVSSSQACLAERTFVRVVEDALQDVTEVRDPLRGITLPVQDWRRVRSPADALSGSWSGAGGAKVVGKSAATCPRGNAVRFDVRQRNLLGRLRGRAVVEVRNLTRVEQYAAAGCDDQPISRQELESFLNDAVRRAARAEAWHLLILASPTGWTKEAVEFATGGNPSSFRDRLVSVVMYQHTEGRFLRNETDEKLGSFRDAFSTDLDAATYAKARKIIDEHLLLRDSIELSTLVRECGVSRKAAARVFRILELSGSLCAAEIEGTGKVLLRRD